MGKKKRYINRAAKFGKKMFNFLDKLDGAQDSNLTDSRIDTSISKISITDRGNRTYAIQVEGRGPGDSTAKANLEQDTVKLTVDGTAVHANNFLVFAAPPEGQPTIAIDLRRPWSPLHLQTIRHRPALYLVLPHTQFSLR